MASFVFTGDPRMSGRDPTPSCTIYGMTFPAGEAVPVESEATAALLRTHNHFTEQKGIVQRLLGPDEKPPEVEDPTKGMSIDDLREMAEGLGIPHDGVGKSDLRTAIRQKLTA